MKGRSVSPALYTLAGSLLLLGVGIGVDPKTSGALVGYARGTLFEPISLIAILAIGIFVRNGWIAVAAAGVAAVAIHYFVLSMDPGVAQLRRVSGEPVSDTFVLLARVWGMLAAVSLVFLAATVTRRWLKSAPPVDGVSRP